LRGFRGLFAGKKNEGGFDKIREKNKKYVRIGKNRRNDTGEGQFSISNWQLAFSNERKYENLK